ncbi:RsmD family RNA methyltransferase [Candidatus Saccharibacteria bacterium]|nr:RsmD family RNA methyltransferase [Candidatus Saccharibacteria bacterium]
MASGFHKPGRTKNSLHILAGKYKGTKLASPNLKTTHPMGSREKLALFNMLAPYLEGAKVLDYFAGSGALGLEALSRGASSVAFVENNPRACQIIKDNCKKCIAGGVNTFFVDILPASKKMYIPDVPDGFARRAVPSADQRMTFSCETGATKKVFTSPAIFDIIISDPPYDDYQVPDYASLLAPGGILALSHPSSFDPKTISGLTLLKTNSYAACNISLFTK